MFREWPHRPHARSDHLKTTERIYTMNHTIESIVGLTPKSIQQHGNDAIVFTFSGGETARFWHVQECCEDVEIDDVNGDWTCLIGNPILVAEERVSEGPCDYGDHETWTFYTFRGIGGSVDVKWHGSSNGYYSESVDFSFAA